jgi:hypothetical protein
MARSAVYVPLASSHRLLNSVLAYIARYSMFGAFSKMSDASLVPTVSSDGSSLLDVGKAYVSNGANAGKADSYNQQCNLN